MKILGWRVLNLVLLILDIHNKLIYLNNYFIISLIWTISFNMDTITTTNLTTLCLSDICFWYAITGNLKDITGRKEKNAIKSNYVKSYDIFLIFSPKLAISPINPYFYRKK